MSKKIELTAEQLAGLDLLISQKQVSVQPIAIGTALALAITNMETNRVILVNGNPAPTAIYTTRNIVSSGNFEIAVAGASRIENDPVLKKQIMELANDIRLEDLIEFRKRVMVKK